MSKTIKNCFDKNLTFEKLLQAHYRARKNKTYKSEVIKFELNLENNIVNLLNNIKNDKYHVGNYYTFKIYEPKERIINALPYRDRIVHQWYVEEFIKPYVGIPIGNYTSQFFANIYLNELDQFIKNSLHIHYYTRYMDDFILLLKTKNECIVVKKQIEEFLKSRLHLELNNKSRFYPYKMGVNFCGYRIFTTHKLLRTNSKKKIKKQVKHWNKKFTCGQLDILHTMKSINSWLGHSSHCNSYKLQNKVLNSCNFIYGSNSCSNSIEEEIIEDMTNSEINNNKSNIASNQ